MEKETNWSADDVIKGVQQYMNAKHVALVKKLMTLQTMCIKSNVVNLVNHILFIQYK